MTQGGTAPRRRAANGRHRGLDAVIAAVVVSIVLGFLLSDLQVGPWWLLPLVTAVIIIVALVMRALRRRQGEPFERRMRILALVVLIGLSVTCAVSVVLLIGFLVNGSDHLTGRRLLLDGGLLWLTNVAVCSLWYYELDGGGPVRRAAGNARLDLLFPQQATEALAHDWRPSYLDYLFVAFTAATAFSPTDTMPLTHRTKMVMLVQGLVSVVLGALVISRAINVLR